ncbi:MAG: alkaline phosphatase family protein [Desulfuromonadales bacterium]|nr:alkaline phosphatase family protein [Desulfuromonadales bacterium]
MATSLTDRLFRLYYTTKFFPLRKERLIRRQAGARHGFVGLQIDGLSAPHLRKALDRGYLPHIGRLLENGYALREYQAGLPSTTPAAQAAIFYGEAGNIPAFRWYDKKTGQLLSCNDPDQVQIFREQLFGGKKGLLAGGSSYSNILDGGAARSVFTVSSPHPQTLFGRFGGLRILLLGLLHPLRVLRLAGATVLEYVAHQFDRRRFRQLRPWRLEEGLFPLIRIFCNVILRELQTFGVIADIYAGVPAIYTTYSGYDELAHHFGPGSRPALKNLKYTDKRIGEILRLLRHAPGAEYTLVILSDHGQTPGYPFRDRFGATLGEAVSAFLRQNQQATVSAGPLEFTNIQLNYLGEELDARRQGWRHRLFVTTRDYMQKRLRQLVPETLRVDPEGGVVITYSSSLAHLYLTGERRRLDWQEVEAAQPLLLRFLTTHKGIGFVIGRGPQGEICFFHRQGRLCLGLEEEPAEQEVAFLRPYGNPAALLPELCRFAADEVCGDLILFGAYDGVEIACFDDQVGGHGSVGGEQLYPFLILPQGHPVLSREHLHGHTFLYWDVFLPCLTPSDSPDI